MSATEPSGAHWCARYPTSASTDALAQPFRGRAEAFIAALRASSCMVRIAATYRPAERAYLMHWACKIAGYKDAAGKLVQVAPASVPAMPGVAIDWTHGGNIAVARVAAAAMVASYQIRFPAALVSRHTQRRAIDMTITWNGILKIRDAQGGLVTIAKGVPNGTNPLLATVGKTYGVVKLASDPPHWSDDGH